MMVLIDSYLTVESTPFIHSVPASCMQILLPICVRELRGDYTSNTLSVNCISDILSG